MRGRGEQEDLDLLGLKRRFSVRVSRTGLQRPHGRLLTSSYMQDPHSLASSMAVAEAKGKKDWDLDP